MGIIEATDEFVGERTAAAITDPLVAIIIYYELCVIIRVYTGSIYVL